MNHSQKLVPRKDCLYLKFWQSHKKKMFKNTWVLDPSFTVTKPCWNHAMLATFMTTTPGPATLSESCGPTSTSPLLSWQRAWQWWQWGNDMKMISSWPIWSNMIEYDHSRYVFSLNSHYHCHHHHHDHQLHHHHHHHHLIGGFNPSEQYESIGMMTFPSEWENKSHVPNHHQPAIILM